MSVYKEHILDHYKNPRNHGEIEDWDAQYTDCNPLCGDEVTIQIKTQNNRIKEIKFKGEGCCISQAATSMLTETVVGKTIREVKQMQDRELLEELGVELAPSRIKCALLGMKALKKAIGGEEC